MKEHTIKNLVEIKMQIPQAKIARFWEALEKGEFLTTKCRKCEKVYFPPTVDCPECYESDMDWIVLSGDAELITWTVAQVAPKGFSLCTPYTIAVSKLKEGPNVMAWLTDVGCENIKHGMLLKLVVKNQSNEKLGYSFVPRQ